MRLGARPGLLVQDGEQGKEVVGRDKEEEGNWEIMGWTMQISWLGLPVRLWLWVGRQQLGPSCSSHTGGERGDRGWPLVCLPHPWGRTIIIPTIALRGDFFFFA